MSFAAGVGRVTPYIDKSKIMLMNSSNSRRVPWGDQMRRVAENPAAVIDWMAPAEVVEDVIAQYLHAIRWLYECERLYSPQVLINGAAKVAIEDFLLDMRIGLMQRSSGKADMVYGVLRADHRVEICGFNAVGDTCYLIDHQTDRRMATYRRTTHERIHTQNLGASALVFRMRYFAQEGRWKISRFEQQLPPGYAARWNEQVMPVERLPEFIDFIGRDA